MLLCSLRNVRARGSRRRPPSSSRRILSRLQEVSAHYNKMIDRRANLFEKLYELGDTCAEHAKTWRQIPSRRAECGPARTQPSLCTPSVVRLLRRVFQVRGAHKRVMCKSVLLL